MRHSRPHSCAAGTVSWNRDARCWPVPCGSSKNWCAAERERIEWVRPDAGALCCVRLRTDAFGEAAVSRFWESLPEHDLQLASGTWFGESDRVFRLGFGYLPPQKLTAALTALATVLDLVTHEATRQ